MMHGGMGFLTTDVATPPTKRITQSVHYAAFHSFTKRSRLIEFVDSVIPDSTGPP